MPQPWAFSKIFTFMAHLERPCRLETSFQCKETLRIHPPIRHFLKSTPEPLNRCHPHQHWLIRPAVHKPVALPKRIGGAILSVPGPSKTNQTAWIHDGYPRRKAPKVKGSGFWRPCNIWG